ncbi:MAG: hypothetical protein R2712_23845 [Vicinamibacterales bacterium]
MPLVDVDVDQAFEQERLVEPVKLLLIAWRSASANSVAMAS